MTLHGHEDDPIQDACLDLRAASCGDGHWSDVPCVCATLKIGAEIGRQEERKAWLDAGHWKLAPHLCRSATPQLHVGEASA